MSIFPTKILLATDGSEEADLALRTAADLAKSTGSELHLMYVEAASHVFPSTDWETFGGGYRPNRLDEAAREAAEAKVDEQARRAREVGGEVAGAHARVGFPDTEIVDLAEELGSGLIVLGSRGFGGLRRALMGSVADSVVRHAHCPVLVTRHTSKAGSEETGRQLLWTMRDIHHERHPDGPLQEGTLLHPRLAAERIDLSAEHPDYGDALGWLQYSGALAPHDPAATPSDVDTVAITRRGLEILEEDA